MAVGTLRNLRLSTRLHTQLRQTQQRSLRPESGSVLLVNTVERCCCWLPRDGITVVDGLTWTSGVARASVPLPLRDQLPLGGGVSGPGPFSFRVLCIADATACGDPGPSSLCRPCGKNTIGQITACPNRTRRPSSYQLRTTVNPQPPAFPPQLSSITWD
jgi:hypothetical protein